MFQTPLYQIILSRTAASRVRVSVGVFTGITNTQMLPRVEYFTFLQSFSQPRVLLSQLQFLKLTSLKHRRSLFCLTGQRCQLGSSTKAVSTAYAACQRL